MASDSEPLRQSILVDLLTSRAYSAISDLLSSYLGMANFLVLCQVCKALHRLKGQRTLLMIGILLRDFVTDPDTFRSQLGRYNAVISGGFALNFFEMGRWKVPYLDLFIEAGDQRDGLVRYIKETEDYDQEHYTNDQMGVARIIISSSKRPGRRIRVAATDGPPILTILSHSYITATVNFITWNKAYSIFPQQTVTRHKFYALKLLNDDFGSVLREQMVQGWTTRDMLWPDLAADIQPEIVHRDRRVGDSSSLLIPLGINNLQHASTPDSVIEYAQFEVSAKSRASPWEVTLEWHGFPQIRSQELSSPALRHKYTFASQSWHDYVTKRLQRWARLELYKLEPEKRPEQLVVGVPSTFSLPRDFELPDTWDFIDDQLPVWYLEWEQMQTEGKNRSNWNRSSHPGFNIVPAR